MWWLKWSWAQWLERRRIRRYCWSYCILDNGLCCCLVGEGMLRLNPGITRFLRLLRMEKRVLKCGVGAKVGGRCWYSGCFKCWKKHPFECYKITAAQPEIANYPFTTLLPNLGVVSFDYDSTMVVADLPGLLEGAHRGFGLGHEFLRHTERFSALVHVVDGSGQQPELEFDAVCLELELFSPELAEKPYIIAYNKMDLPEACENWPSFKEKLQGRGIETFCMSAVKREGTHEVVCATYKLLQKSKESNEGFEDFQDPVDLNHVVDMVQKQRSSSISEFEITHDSSCNTWHVTGAGLQRFVQMTNWLRYIDSERRFQHVLEACGVNRSLRKLGVKEGDTVIVGEMEMVWHDSTENSGTPNMKKRSTESIKWPQWK